jgi:hypothetical protein
MNLPLLPQWARDAIISDVTVRLGFWDRFRVLVHGEIKARIVAFAEYRPGRLESTSTVDVKRHLRLYPSMGMIESTPPRPILDEDIALGRNL